MIVSEPVVFEWDRGNVDKNLVKHQVTMQEIEESFTNRPIYIFDDRKHSTAVEKRFGMFGKTNQERLLATSFTIRKDKIRVISSRDMSRKEREAYEKIKANSQI